MSVAYTVLRLAAKHQWPATRWLQLSVAGRRVATTTDGYNCRWLQPLVASRGTVRQLTHIMRIATPCVKYYQSNIAMLHFRCLFLHDTMFNNN